MKAITIHQPHATLVALGVKTIETRSWSTAYRGSLLIHAGARWPDAGHLPPLWSQGVSRQEQEDHNGQTWLVCPTITDPAYKGPQPQGRRIPRRAQTPTLFYPPSGPHGRPHVPGTPATEQGTAIYLPLGALVARANLVDVAPIGAWDSFRTGYFEGDEGDLPGQAVVVYHPSTGSMPESLVLDSGGRVTDITDQLPYGDYRPGRFAWLFEDVHPIDPPVPARGRQGLWTP